MKRRRKVATEQLESRRMLAASLGWDGPGNGSAELTYYIGDAPSSLSQRQVDTAIETALKAWSDVADIEFTETSQPGQLDSLDFTFKQLDGSAGVLAQAYFPDDINPARIAGDVQFDISEQWEIGNARGGRAFDLVGVAVHEIGHALGLNHSHEADSILRPSISANDSFHGLSDHDVEDILALYAPAKPSREVTPTDGLPQSPGSHTHLPNQSPNESPSTPDESSEPESDLPKQSLPPSNSQRWSWYFRRWTHRVQFYSWFGFSGRLQGTSDFFGQGSRPWPVSVVPPQVGWNGQTAGSLDGVNRAGLNSIRFITGQFSENHFGLQPQKLRFLRMPVTKLMPSLPTVLGRSTESHSEGEGRPEAANGRSANNHRWHGQHDEALADMFAGEGNDNHQAVLSMREGTTVNRLAAGAREAGNQPMRTGPRAGYRRAA